MVTEDVPTTCFPIFRSGGLVLPILYPEGGYSHPGKRRNFPQQRPALPPCLAPPQCGPHFLASHDSQSKSFRGSSGEPHRTNQDSSVGGDGMSGRRKEKTVVTDSKETKTSSLGGMRKWKSYRKGACELKHLKKGRNHQ